MLELYHSGLTTCSKQVRLCLREKEIPYKSHYIELWNYENLNPDQTPRFLFKSADTIFRRFSAADRG